MAWSLRLALGCVGITVGVASVVLARAHPQDAFAGNSPWAAAAEVTAAAALAVAGLVLLSRSPGSRAGRLLVAAGLASFAVEWANPAAPGLVFALGLALFGLEAALVADATLAYPSDGLENRAERRVVRAGYVVAIACVGLGPTLLFDPSAMGCAACPANPLLVHAAPGLMETLWRCGLWLGLAWSVWLTAVALMRVTRLTVAARRVCAPVIVAAVAFGSLLAADRIHSLARGFQSNDPVDRALWLGERGALVLLAVGVIAAPLRDRRMRTAVARLIAELGETPAPGRLRDVLAAALDDPGLVVAYPLADGRHVDAAGLPIDLQALATTRAVTPLMRGDRTIAQLAHDRRLLDRPGLVEQIAAAARLAVDNERLQSEIRAQVEDLRSSRARLAAAGNAERRRLQRDLHDGAQQRLVGVRFALGLSRRRLAPDAAAVTELAAADAEVAEALAALRELAAGMPPAVLGSQGLATNVRAVAADAAIPVTVGALPRDRFAPVLEEAACLLLAETLNDAARRGGATRAAVAVRHEPTRLVIEVVHDGAVTASRSRIDLGDRLAALGGDLHTSNDSRGGIRLRLELPCAS